MASRASLPEMGAGDALRAAFRRCRARRLSLTSLMAPARFSAVSSRPLTSSSFATSRSISARQSSAVLRAASSAAAP